MTVLVLVSLGAMVLAMGIFSAPPPPGAPPPGAPLGPPPSAAGEEIGQEVGPAALRGAALLDVLLDVLLPDEHAASTIPSTAAVASVALAFLLTMPLRLLP